MKAFRVALYPGDGIGVDVIREGVKALQALQDVCAGFRL